MGDQDKAPFPFRTEFYKDARKWFEVEDVLAGLSLPLIKKLAGKSPRFRDFIMGFINQVLARNILDWLGSEKGNVITMYSARSILAGALAPIEGWLLRRESLSLATLTRELSEGAVASMVAASLSGSWVAPALPAYVR